MISEGVTVLGRIENEKLAVTALRLVELKETEISAV